MHDCSPFIREFGSCKPCEDARPKTPVSFNSALLKALEQSCIEDIQAHIDYTIIRHLSDASKFTGDGYIAAKLKGITQTRPMQKIYDIGSRDVCFVPGRTDTQFIFDAAGKDWEGECRISFI